MIKEAYVSYEIAQLLKKKGFDERTLYHYTNCDVLQHNIVYNQYKNSEILNAYSAPTHQMACAWLREVHNIIIVIEPRMYDYVNEKTSSYVTSLWQGDNYYENITSKDYPTYEEAVEATLKYVLENLI